MAISFDIRRNDMKTVLSSIGDAKNLLSTAEGGLKKISDILVKMKNKALEAKGDTIGDNERTAIAAQLNQFSQEIDDTVAATQWNGTDLLDSNAGLKLLTGVNGTGAGTTTDFKFSAEIDLGTGLAALGGYKTTQMGLKVGVGAGALSYAATDLATGSVDANVISKLNIAIGVVKTGITDTGTMTARLTFKEDSMTVAYNNTEAAYNRIMNADMAAEQVEASKYTILQNTATTMLAQANAAPQSLLALFR
jgi:flagellin